MTREAEMIEQQQVRRNMVVVNTMVILVYREERQQLHQQPQQSHLQLHKLERRQTIAHSGQNITGRTNWI